MTKFSLSLDSLAEICGGKTIGNGKLIVETLCSADRPLTNALAFVASHSLAKHLDFRKGTFYIVKEEWANSIDQGICHPNPQQAFRLVLQSLKKSQIPSEGVSQTAIVSDSALIGENVSIGANSVLGERVRIGDNCRVGCGVIIESDTEIGDNCTIGHRVVIHDKTIIGSDCVISEGAVVAGQGFGFSFEGGSWFAVPQVGRVIIGNRVHIGANTCIDRGAINDTTIGNNVIIDNLVHIAHNVEVGSGTAMAAGVGIAGSAVVGKHCLLAGQVGVVGHIEIADGVQINGGARVLQSIKQSGTYAGSFHVQPVRKWNRIAIYLKKLETLFKREK